MQILFSFFFFFLQSSQIYLKLTSDNTVRIDDIVEQINVTSLVQTSKDDLKIDVIVSEVFYPTFFWVILNENKKKLRSFVKKMKYDTFL